MFDDAIKAYKEAISINPKIAEIHNNLGIAYAKKGIYNQALYHYDVALELEKNYRYYYNKSISLIKLGRYEKAKKTLKLAISENPEYKKARELYNALEEILESQEIKGDLK
jgi:tetratricopeptide (TPR) repeat protein